MARLLAPTLQKLIDSNTTTAKDLGEMAGVSSSTIYRWINGESEPDFDSIRLILHHLSDTDAQLAILTAFIAGTPWTVTQTVGDLDVNQDGHVGTEDALDSAISCVLVASDSLQQIRMACRDGKVTQAEAQRVAQLLADVINQCSITQQVVMSIAQPVRKKAK
ncbi:MAG: helix-turn-helix transcriptional regulator [Phycisphaeraceae bacterium]|nr:helix-turn-helix transcriptional regulator [Phycisphaeraceae bacterium]